MFNFLLVFCIGWRQGANKMWPGKGTGGHTWLPHRFRKGQEIIRQTVSSISRTWRQEGDQIDAFGDPFGDPFGDLSNIDESSAVGCETSLWVSFSEVWAPRVIPQSVNRFEQLRFRQRKMFIVPAWSEAAFETLQKLPQGKFACTDLCEIYRVEGIESATWEEIPLFARQFSASKVKQLSKLSKHVTPEAASVFRVAHPQRASGGFGQASSPDLANFGSKRIKRATRHGWSKVTIG